MKTHLKYKSNQSSSSMDKRKAKQGIKTRRSFSFKTAVAPFSECKKHERSVTNTNEIVSLLAGGIQDGGTASHDSIKNTNKSHNKNTLALTVPGDLCVTGFTLVVDQLASVAGKLLFVRHLRVNKSSVRAPFRAWNEKQVVWNITFSIRLSQTASELTGHFKENSLWKVRNVFTGFSGVEHQGSAASSTQHFSVHILELIVCSNRQNYREAFMWDTYETSLVEYTDDNMSSSK